MTARDLLAEARRRGATFLIDGDRLRLRAPAGAVPPDLREALSARKPEILKALAAEAGPQAPALPTLRCAICGRGKLQIQNRRPRCIPCDGAFGPLVGVVQP